MTRVLIEPRRIRNCFWFSLCCGGKISELIIAACDAPSPGRKEAMGEIRAVAIIGLMSSFFEMRSFPIF